MPDSAIATGAVDIVASVEHMPGEILKARRARLSNGPISLEQIDQARLAICVELQRQIDHDFSGYKEKTFLRRVERRMQVLGIPLLTDYVTRLQGDREEGLKLFSDLLIGVTSFFAIAIPLRF